jgi:hypothetical protein
MAIHRIWIAVAGRYGSRGLDSETLTINTANHMNYSYDELRSRISILDFAQDHGYSVNCKQGVHWSVLEHGSGDKIIIINPRDSQN